MDAEVAVTLVTRLAEIAEGPGPGLVPRSKHIQCHLNCQESEYHLCT
jgi:hypothetical protein